MQPLDITNTDVWNSIKMDSAESKCTSVSTKICQSIRANSELITVETRLLTYPTVKTDV